MKLFGTVKTFDETKGFGLIKPEIGNEELRFENSAVSWGDATTPKTERRLSYEVGKNGSGDACAINLHSA
jgi:cold shock CspA family protein